MVYFGYFTQSPAFAGATIESALFVEEEKKEKQNHFSLRRQMICLCGDSFFGSLYKYSMYVYAS